MTASALTDPEQFRLDVLKIFAGIRVEIDAIHEALKEGNCVTSKRLNALRKQSASLEDRFLDRYAQKVGPL